MTAYDFVHLVLHAAGDRVEGRTKLQKLVYFAGILTDQLEELGYKPHFYGPYSSKVAASVDKLRALNFLDQSLASAGAIDSRGFEVARYDYRLTDDGRSIADEKAQEEPHVWERIRQAVHAVENSRFDYVKLSIAAKAYFLQKTSPALDADTLGKRCERLGWKVSPKELEEAFNWLKSVGLSTPA